MKHSDILALDGAIRSCGNLAGVKFAYALSKNLRLIEPIVKSMADSLQPGAEFKAYNLERVQLAEKHCIKDASDRPVIADGKYQFTPQDRITFDARLNDLQVKFADAIAERKQQEDDYIALLDSEIDEQTLPVFHIVKLADVPEGITAGQLEGIHQLIAE